ncbi:MAG TPA: hypothetical protein VFY28_03110, partial [Candidatus Paceibacterota bacterium]|nr:hypothetical protein [Candidatus Paceibacterota bacterium]
MNETRREQVRYDRFLRLARTLRLSIGEGLDEIIAETLPIGRRIDPYGAKAFSMHYGLGDYEIAELREIAKELGLHYGSARFHVVSFTSLIEEIARAMRSERTMPDDHTSWPLEDFFTTARGLECRIERKLATRVRTVAGREKVEFPTVGHFCRLTEPEVARICGSGVATARAMQAMLVPVGLSLGLRIPRMKKAA